MNLLYKLDSKLIDAHQWVLDKTQVEPDTAAKWCWYGVIVLTIVKCALLASEGAMDASAYVTAFFALLSSAISYRWLIQWPRSMHKSLPWVRMVLAVCLLIPYSPSAYNAASWVYLACVTIGMYFRACDKPKPPVRKTKLAFN